MSKLAVISPSTLLGREVLGLLADLPAADDVAFYSGRLAGMDLTFGNREVVIEQLDDDLLEEPPTVALFAGVPQQSRQLARKLVEAGTRVVDLTSAFRLDPTVPLLVEVPAGAVPPLVSLPGGAALAAYRALRPLIEASGLAGLDATLLVPVSAAGAAGVRELSRQSAALLGGRSLKTKRFPHRIAFNLHPGPGESAGTETKSEHAFREELRRILVQPTLPVTVSSVRVPVFFGLSLGLTWASERPSRLGEMEALYRNPSHGELKVLAGTGVEAMPSLAAGDPSVLIGRLRGEGTHWQLWACVDPLRMRAKLAVDLVARLL